MKKLLYIWIAGISVACVSGSVRNFEASKAQTYCKDREVNLFYFSASENPKLENSGGAQPLVVKEIQVENSHYLAAVDASQLKPSDSKIISFSAAPLLPEKGTYAAKFSWGDPGESFNFQFSFSCLEALKEEMLKVKLKEAAVPGKCFVSAGGELTANTSLFNREDLKNQKVVLDVKYKIASGREWHLTGTYLLSETKGKLDLKEYPCNVRCQDQSEVIPFGAGDHDINGVCNYDCETGIQGDFSYSYYSAQGPDSGEFLIPENNLSGCTLQAASVASFTEKLKINL